jgi:hypothetical protein
MPEILRRALGQATKMYIFYRKSQSTTTPLSVPVKQKPRQNTRKPSKLRVSLRKPPWTLESSIELCALERRQSNKNKRSC